MASDDELRQRWQATSVADADGVEALSAESFCLLLNMIHWLSGSFYHLNVFDDLRSALAFVRYCLIPQHLGGCLDDPSESPRDVHAAGEDYYADFPKQLATFHGVVDRLDASLAGDGALSDDQFRTLVAEFNSAFATYEPWNEGGRLHYLPYLMEIEAWGDMGAVLASTRPLLEDEDDDELSELAALVRQQSFDATDSHHLRLAQDYLRALQDNQS